MPDNAEEGVRWGAVLPDKVKTHFIEYEVGQFLGPPDIEPAEEEQGFWDICLR